LAEDEASAEKNRLKSGCFSQLIVRISVYMKGHVTQAQLPAR
jgi:hypothetical protein